jgi:hypothetical protein
MQFYEPFVLWRGLKKIDKETYKNVSWKEFYSKQISYSLLSGRDQDGNAASMGMEKIWLEEGCPYYKLWPGVFDQFASTRMDIDTQFLKSPHKSFAINFPIIEDHLLSFKIKDDTFFVTSILVEDFTAEEVNNTRKEIGLLQSVNDMFRDDAFSHLNIPEHEYETGIIKVRIDFKSEKLADRYIDGLVPSEGVEGLLREMNPPGQFFRNIPVVPNKTIEETIGIFVDTPAMENSFTDETIPASVIEACFRILIGIYFVSTGSQKVLEYDVISKHLNAYQKMREEGNKDKSEEYEKKAKKKGKFGWNVGANRRGRNLILPKGVTYDEAFKQAGSRELLYRHTRGGHWHTYWTGSKDNRKDIVKWVEETTVRSDLPIRPLKR